MYIFVYICFFNGYARLKFKALDFYINIIYVMYLMCICIINIMIF